MRDVIEWRILINKRSYSLICFKNNRPTFGLYNISLDKAVYLAEQYDYGSDESYCNIQYDE